VATERSRARLQAHSAPARRVAVARRRPCLPARPTNRYRVSSTALVAAAVGLVSPGLLYAGYVTPDALGYALALAAVWAGVRMLELPSVASQVLFLVVSAAATFARLQYVVLVPAALCAAAIIERGRMRVVARRLCWGRSGACRGHLRRLRRALVGPIRHPRRVPSKHQRRHLVRLVSLSARHRGQRGSRPRLDRRATAEIARPSDRARFAFSSLSVTLVALCLFSPPWCPAELDRTVSSRGSPAGGAPAGA
jgi:hypothetical protein